MFKVIPFEFLLQMIPSIHTLINLSHMRGKRKKKNCGKLGVVGGVGNHCVSSGFPEVCTELADTCHS